MSPGAIFTKKPKKPHHGSRIRAAASLVANILGEVGGMVPVVGPCIEGVAEAAKRLLESLEDFENNREDIADLAEEIRDIVIIIRDAGIEISETPESIKYAKGLQKTCLKFQEFLCKLSTQMNEINRSKGGVWGNIAEFLNHRDVKASISRHRKLIEDARSNFQSQVMLDSALVLLRNSASISRLNEQVSSIKSILLTLSQANNGNTINDEMQVVRQYRMPDGGDLVGGFQEMGTVQSGRNTHSVSASKLVEWLCQLQCCLVFLRWLHFRWSLSLKFEISLATPSRNAGGSRTWAVLIGIGAYPDLPLRGCVADALLMQKYMIEHLGVPEGRIQLLIGSHHLPYTGLSPTRSNIIKTLSSLITNPDIQHGDGITIHFSGCEVTYLSQDSDGSTVKPRGGSIIALRPIDSDGLDGLNISDREISTILHLISSSRKARITLILDCCRSGGFSTGKLSQRREVLQPGYPLFQSIPIDMSINMLNVGHETLKHFPGYQSIVAEDWCPNMESYVLLAACQDFQPAMEMKSPSRQTYQGLFTDTLVRALTSNVLKDRSTFVDLLEALRPLMQHEQTPVVIGKYKDAPIWFRD